MGPTLFAVLAISLLVYDHLNRQVTAVVFWLGVGLVIAVVGRMIETVRRESGLLREELRNARNDEVTGLEKRAKLQADVEAALARSGDRRVLVLLELDGLHGYADRFGYRAGDDLLCLFAQALVSAVAPLGGTAYRIDASRLAALVPAGRQQLGEVVLAATAPVREVERDQLITSAHGEALIPEEAKDPELAFRIASQRLTAHKQRQHRSARRQAHAVLVAVLLARRPEMSEQLLAVAFHAISLGRRLGAGSEEIDDIALAAELHEVGLLALPDAVARGEAPLDEQGAAMLRNHTVEGQNIIASAAGLAPVANLVRASSEQFDGRGYPDGLVGEQIPLGARIIAVVAAYAAITAPPHPRQGRSTAEAILELRSRAGSRFDPRVVEALAQEIMEQNMPAMEENVPAPAA